jgi:hypothetical protein
MGVDNMFILTDSDGVLVAIGNEVVESNEEQGVICINGAHYGLVGQMVWELENIPEHIVPDKYKYVDGEFIINENYKPYVDVETLSNQIDILEGTIAELMIILGGMQ